MVDPGAPRSRSRAADAHHPEDDVAQRRRKRGRKDGASPGSRGHQLRDDSTGHDAGDGAADRDLVGNNKMLEVDEGGGDKERDKNPIGDRHFPRKTFPDEEEEERGQELDEKVAE